MAILVTITYTIRRATSPPSTSLCKVLTPPFFGLSRFEHDYSLTQTKRLTNLALTR